MVMLPHSVLSACLGPLTGRGRPDTGLPRQCLQPGAGDRRADGLLPAGKGGSVFWRHPSA